MQIKLLGLLGFLMMLASCQHPGEPDTNSGSPASSFRVVADDAAWCWFSDPRAVYYKGEKEQLYYGYINSSGDVMVSAKPVKDSSVQTAILHEQLNKDDHAVPSILFLPDGRLAVFYSAHNGHHVYMRMSTKPEDITSWEEERVISDDSAMRYTYTNPVMLSGEHNRIYLFGREVAPESRSHRDRYYTYWYQYFIYSDDLGKTWSKSQIMLKNTKKNSPIYMKVCSDNRSRIDFLFTNGHPKTDPDISIFHMYYQSGHFFQTNGKKIVAMDELPIALQENNINKVYEAEVDHVRSWIWDIALDKNNRPVITYTRYPRATDHRYYYGYWDGAAWQSQEICQSGGWMCSLDQGDKVLEANYSGGVVLDHNNPSSVYLAKQIDGFFEIEHKSWDGKSWEMDRITSHSDQNNVRPFVVSGDNRAFLFWMSGFYHHYTKYDTDLRLTELSSPEAE